MKTMMIKLLGLAAVALVSTAALVEVSDVATSRQAVATKGDMILGTEARLDRCRADTAAMSQDDCIEALIDQEFAAQNVRYVTIGGKVAPATSRLVKIEVAE